MWYWLLVTYFSKKGTANKGKKPPSTIPKAAAFGIVLGGFLPLLAVPFLEKYVTKSQYHNVVGDHEDLKKDLKSKHI